MLSFKKLPTQAADDITESIDAAVIQRKRAAIKALESKAAAPATGELLFMRFIEPALFMLVVCMGAGGQEEAILRQMLGAAPANMLLETTAGRGTALHRRKQREILKQFPAAEIEKPVEDIENKITGHIDALYKEGGKTIVADIKTVYSSKQFDRLREIIDEINARKITIQEKLVELKDKDVISDTERNVIRRLEDYLNQVNIYMKGIEDAEGKILLVNMFDPKQELTLPIGKFDPNKFKTDIEAVNKSREKVSKIITSVEGGFGVPADLLKDYPKLYEELTTQLKEVSAEQFIKGLPTRPTGEMAQSSKEVLDRLNTSEEKLYDRLTKEMLDIYQAFGGPGKV